MASQLPTHVGRDLYEDLVGVGFRGFVEAMQRLDPERPETSEAYVKQFITGAMLDELRRLDPLSRDQRRRQREMREIERGLTRGLGRLPSQDEIAVASKMSIGDYHRVAGETTPLMLSLDSSPTEDGESLGNMIGDESVADPQQQTLVRERSRLLRDAMTRLSATHRMVVQRYYFEGDTLQTIGDGLNVCAARASQIRKEAVDRMRDEIVQRLAS